MEKPPKAHWNTHTRANGAAGIGNKPLLLVEGWNLDEIPHAALVM
jgi:hypothetical protein